MMSKSKFEFSTLFALVVLLWAAACGRNEMPVAQTPAPVTQTPAPTRQPDAFAGFYLLKSHSSPATPAWTRTGHPQEKWVVKELREGREYRLSYGESFSVEDNAALFAWTADDHYRVEKDQFILTMKESVGSSFPVEKNLRILENTKERLKIESKDGPWVAKGTVELWERIPKSKVETYVRDIRARYISPARGMTEAKYEIKAMQGKIINNVADGKMFRTIAKDVKGAGGDSVDVYSYTAREAREVIDEKSPRRLPLYFLVSSDIRVRNPQRITPEVPANCPAQVVLRLDLEGQLAQQRQRFSQQEIQMHVAVTLPTTTTDVQFAACMPWVAQIRNNMRLTFNNVGVRVTAPQTTDLPTTFFEFLGYAPEVEFQLER